MRLSKARLQQIPHAPGVYMFTRRGVPIYIGKAADLRTRLGAYRPGGGWKTDMLIEATGLRITRTDSELEALLLEANWIKAKQPRYNVTFRDQKDFPAIEMTNEEFPQVRLTRTFGRSGTYLGPFTSAYAARETLRALRRVFPFRCNRKPIVDSRKPEGKPCLYFHMGLCAGTCAGRITAEQYRRRVITPFRRLLEGKTTSARRLLDPEHRQLLDSVLLHSRVLSVTEKYAADLRDLQRVLHLPRLPHRIEGYDVSNLHGIEAVASMVVAIDGEPAPSEYKRFKVRTLEGQSNDVGMLREVLTRRAAHRSRIGNDESRIMGKDEWPDPDLILVDGGKPQRNAVLRVLRAAEWNVPLVALAKREEECYLPGEQNPLRLPRNSPALHLLQRIRDEAHRFAVSYHRRRYSKRILLR